MSKYCNVCRNFTVDLNRYLTDLRENPAEYHNLTLGMDILTEDALNMAGDKIVDCTNQCNQFNVYANKDLLKALRIVFASIGEGRMQDAIKNAMSDIMDKGQGSGKYKEIVMGQGIQEVIANTLKKRQKGC
ncbi:MAG: hypothetical protein NTU57_03265 [Candidatus Aenigmarchaeota archaeon]|nr:hypothetical protein [Candidatus Aenigmarchaeota archaeon]